MSIKIMSAAWGCSEVTDAGELCVLLALADFADDDGWCWPSMVAIGKKARMSDRQARTYIRRLEAKGLIECPSTKGGSGHPNRYRVTPEGGSQLPCSKAETRKPASEIKGGKAEVERQKGGSLLPRNPLEPSKTDTSDVGRATDFPDFIEPDVARSFIAHRRLMKAPMTKRAIAQLSKHLSKIRDGGRDPNAALDLAMAKGWRTIEAEWAEKALPSAQPKRRLTDEERAERDRIMAKLGLK